MSAIDISLLAAAIVVCALSWRINPRGILWVLTAAASFAASTAYWRTGLPYAEGVAGICDAAVCLSVYFIGRQRWEMWIWRLFQTSVAINFLYLAGNIGIFAQIPHDTYSIMLEAINWMTLLLIGGMSTMQRIGFSDGSAHRPWDRVRVALHSLREERTEPSFLRAPR